MACMTARPSGVDYAKLIEATRAQIERRYSRPASEKRFRRFLFSIFTRPARLRTLLLPLRLYQKAELEPRATRRALRLRVAYHDACHLQHAHGVRTQPRALLGRIPHLELLEIPEAAICCGSAGIYNLVQPEAAAQLGDRKAGHVAALDADMAVSGNPGCLLQLQSALARAGRKLPVRHSVELLDASIRDVSL
jgi:Fe-S oxidoreductase